MSESDASAARLPAPKPLGLLAWIVGYKLIKAFLAMSGAMIVFRVGRQNPVAVVHHWLHRLHLDPEGWLGTRLLNRAAHFDITRLQWVGILLLAYTILYCVEAVGLFFEKRWAEWLTVVQTALLVPLEIREVARGHRAAESAALLLLSLGVIVYLIWRLHDDDADEEKPKNLDEIRT